MVESEPTAATSEAFTYWYPDRALERTAVKIIITPGAEPPPYVILRRPAPAEDAQLFVAAYRDADTSDLDWTPVSGSFDPRTGLLSAGIGLGRFQPGQTQSAQASRLAVAQGGTAYSLYADVSVGGQPFLADITIIPEEPLEPLEVPVDGPPIPVRARVGGQLVNLTHQPLDELTVTSDFGPRDQPVEGASTNHQGVDYRAVDGTPVYAAGDGVVIRSGCQLNSVNCGKTAAGGITGGYIVEIDHGDGVTTRYMHMQNPADVAVGDVVTGGQVIGRSDSTGGVSAHLHFEVKKNGTAVDPELIDEAQLTVTAAMALDAEVQEETRQEIRLTRGILTAADMQQYVDIFDLTDIERGDYSLHFAVIDSGGSISFGLPPVPLTIFDLTGEWQDGPRILSLVQEGNQVTATIIEGELICGLGPGTPAFSGTVGEDILDSPITGSDLLACNPPDCAEDGLLPETVTLPYEGLVENANTITIEWVSQQYDSDCAPTYTIDTSFTMTRIPKESPAPDAEPEP